MISLGVMVAMFVALGVAAVMLNLPGMVADPADPGLHPPAWLNDYDWAKPALMFMGFWAAIGSNNMLLYLAALTNVPQELYEAADIDGASRLQRFWNVTWPQLAPTTFFITVMSVIGGLQGGFESARTMTPRRPRRQHDHAQLLHLHRGLRDRPLQLRLRRRVGAVPAGLRRDDVQLEVREQVRERLRSPWPVVRRQLHRPMPPTCRCN